MKEIPVWRSLLFVPVNNEKFVSKAHRRGADAVILDLEDSIAPSQKSKARAKLMEVVQQVASYKVDVLVRVNTEFLDLDVTAAALRSVAALIIPKVVSAADVQKVADLLDHLETERSLPPGGIRLLAQIEDVRALPALDQIATATPRLFGMSLGSEDFSASAGMQPLAETLYGPNQSVAFACRRAGISPFGFPASIGLFDDQPALVTAATQAANMGFVGAFCIHPDQIAILNDAFSPSAHAVADAKILVQEFEKAEAQGVSVFAHKGQMVDLPVVLRARELVTRAEIIAKRAKNQV